MKLLAAVVLALCCVSCNVCTGPKNADAFPSSPVPVQESTCHYYQVYEATSPNANYDSRCGYAVVFGPKGDLKHPADGYWLQADWGDTPPTAANCADSHTAAQAWGYRCDNADCTQGAWERIEKWKTRSGTWNSVSNVCYLGLGFNAVAVDYNTVEVEVRAWRGSGTNKVQKRVKGHIYVYRNNAHCASVPVEATPSPQITFTPPRPQR